jgi:hypothetical protein
MLRRNVALATLATLVATGAAPAQAGKQDPQDFSSLVNYAYASVFGSGLYVVAGQSVNLYRIPISFTVYRAPEERWTARLRLPLTLGFYEFNVDDLFEGGFPDDLQTAALVPMVEFTVRLGTRWRVVPTAGFGAAKDASGGPVVWVYDLGISGYFEQSFARSKLTVGGTFLYAGSKAKGLRTDALGMVEAGVDYTHHLGFNLGSHRAMGGIYGVARYYLNDIEFVRASGEPVTVDAEYEVGISLGIDPPYKWWKIKVPRFGLGYRYSGGEIAAIRFTVGFPF